MALKPEDIYFRSVRVCQVDTFGFSRVSISASLHEQHSFLLIASHRMEGYNLVFELVMVMIE